MAPESLQSDDEEEEADQAPRPNAPGAPPGARGSRAHAATLGLTDDQYPIPLSALRPDADRDESEHEGRQRYPPRPIAIAERDSYRREALRTGAPAAPPAAGRGVGAADKTASRPSSHQRQQQQQPAAKPRPKDVVLTMPLAASRATSSGAIGADQTAPRATEGADADRSARSDSTTAAAVARELFGTYAFLTVAMFATTEFRAIGFGIIGVVASHAAALWCIASATRATCNPTVLLASQLFPPRTDGDGGGLLFARRPLLGAATGYAGWIVVLLTIVGQFVAGILAGVTVEYVCQVDVGVAAPEAMGLVDHPPVGHGFPVARACMTIIVSSILYAFAALSGRTPAGAPRGAADDDASDAADRGEIAPRADPVSHCIALLATEASTAAYVGAWCMNPAYHLGTNVGALSTLPFSKTGWIYYVFFPVASFFGGLAARLCEPRRSSPPGASASLRRRAAADASPDDQRLKTNAREPPGGR